MIRKQMKSIEAKTLGDEIAVCLRQGNPVKAEILLAPIFLERIPFSTLDKIGLSIGCADAESVYKFSDQLAKEKKMGGWVIIASALSCHLSTDLVGALEESRKLIVTADVWYATDIFGERIAGTALLVKYHPALQIMSSWRQDPNRWVRRSTGVAVHFWAKRNQGTPDSLDEAKQLLSLLEPVLEEHDRDAAKGFGWGLKTLGRYYPDLLQNWLYDQVFEKGRRLNSTILRKAITFLPTKEKFILN